jgi:hypothetical protein
MHGGDITNNIWPAALSSAKQIKKGMPVSETRSHRLEPGRNDSRATRQKRSDRTSAEEVSNVSVEQVSHRIEMSNESLRERD